MTKRYATPRRTLTTNGSGLLDRREGKRVIDWVCENDFKHLNISRAHHESDRNAHIMVLKDGLSRDQLKEVVRLAREAGTRVRLSCVLLHESMDTLERIRDYLEFARDIGVDNVIFRQLMKVNHETVAENFVVRYSDRQRVDLEPILDSISEAPDFEFQKQIVGYYYYVEVWKYAGMDIVFEEADLAQLERVKSESPDVIHELIFHPNAKLASTWQPWDGVLGPS